MKISHSFSALRTSALIQYRRTLLSSLALSAAVSITLAAPLAAKPVFSAGESHTASADCPVIVPEGKIDFDSSLVDNRYSTYQQTGPNLEQASLAMSSSDACAMVSNDEYLSHVNHSSSSGLPVMQLSIDGKAVGGTHARNAADQARCADVAFAQHDLQIRFDGFEVTPWLNVDASDDSGALLFSTYSNYRYWIERAEIRIFSEDQSSKRTPAAILPVTIGNTARWTNDAEQGERMYYVLRVYDKQGRFDETRKRPILPVFVEQDTQTGKRAPVDANANAGYGENSRELENIPVHGAAVTVNGRNFMRQRTVRVMGVDTPVDEQGTFAMRQILPAGPQTVTVEFDDANARRVSIERSISIASDDWFYIALADLTVGENDTSGPAKLVTADETDQFDDEVYVDGRLAFYLKGKIKGKYLLTAAADTREQPLDSLFSNFSDKDPRALLRRLDPDRYYPVYGDDSTTIEDAPTQGKFYVKLERDDSHVLWGNFHTRITGTDLIQYNRGLYGANIRWTSDEQTQYGEKRALVDVFGADPGTLPGRDEFRGTGGSLYYLRRQDVTQGSERVWVEVRDKDSGIVLETRYLAPQQDYDFNYIQGRVMLREPLSSIASDTSLVRTGSLSGHPAFLVTTYEYTPGISTADDLVRGGRGEVWVDDHVKLGVAAYGQNATGLEQDLAGADITVRHKPGTYIKAEVARSEGAGHGQNDSPDGGFRFQSNTAVKRDANAVRVEAAVDLAELSETASGQASVYWQEREAGFAAPGQLTGTSDEELQGFTIDWDIDRDWRLHAKADDSDRTNRHTSVGEVDVAYSLDESWELAAGVRGDRRRVTNATASDTLNRVGNRLDGQLRLTYDAEPTKRGQWSAYGFFQQTLDHSGTRRENDRVGLGGEKRVNEKFRLRAEISDGDGDVGGLLGSDFQYSDRTNLFLNYQIDTDRTDTGTRGRRGVATAGSNIRYSDSVSVFNEEKWQHGDGPSGLTHAFGVDLAPNDRWTYGINLESGTLTDDFVGDFDRRAAGLSIGYAGDNTRYASNLEFRREHSRGPDRDDSRRTWLWRNNYSHGVNPDWRYLGRLNLSFSEASQGAFYDGDFVELVNGFAYRPIANDKLNTLFKYTYLYDLPSAGQLTGAGGLADYSQRSHVLSADGAYDVLPWLTVGAKYAYRRGELRENRNSGRWFDSVSRLGILRADIHIVRKWDITLEGRSLEVESVRDQRTGALFTLYRHVGSHMKAGLGYNFTDYSDDLTDLSFDSDGWFINVVGKL